MLISVDSSTESGSLMPLLQPQMKRKETEALNQPEGRGRGPSNSGTDGAIPAGRRQPSKASSMAVDILYYYIPLNAPSGHRIFEGAVEEQAASDEFHSTSSF